MGWVKHNHPQYTFLPSRDRKWVHSHHCSSLVSTSVHFRATSVFFYSGSFGYPFLLVAKIFNLVTQVAAQHNTGIHVLAGLPYFSGVHLLIICSLHFGFVHFDKKEWPTSSSSKRTVVSMKYCRWSWCYLMIGFRTYLSSIKECWHLICLLMHSSIEFCQTICLCLMVKA